MERTVCFKGLRWVLFFLVVSILSLSPVAPASAEEEKTSPTLGVSAYVDFMSQYVFRGLAASAGSAVIQPSVTFEYCGFSLNVWGNLDTNEKLFGHDASYNETDVTLSYSRTLVANLVGTAGYIHYFTEHVTDANEFFGGLAYSFPWLTVGVSGYREFHEFPGWWMQIDLSRNFPLPCYGMNVDVGASFGYLDSDPQNFSDWHSCTLSAALNIPIGKHYTISPKLGVAFPLTEAGANNIEANSWDGDSTHVFGGLRLSASF